MLLDLGDDLGFLLQFTLEDFDELEIGLGLLYVSFILLSQFLVVLTRLAISKLNINLRKNLYTAVSVLLSLLVLVKLLVTVRFLDHCFHLVD